MVRDLYTEGAEVEGVDGGEAGRQVSRVGVSPGSAEGGMACREGGLSP